MLFAPSPFDDVRKCKNYIRFLSSISTMLKIFFIINVVSKQCANCGEKCEMSSGNNANVKKMTEAELFGQCSLLFKNKLQLRCIRVAISDAKQSGATQEQLYSIYESMKGWSLLLEERETTNVRLEKMIVLL